MNRKQSYIILGIAEGASLNEVKKAYRKRAFELHPDLSQAPDASKKFQELNEAYVLMLGFLEEDISLQAKAKKTNSKTTGGKSKATDSTSTKAPTQDQTKQTKWTDQNQQPGRPDTTAQEAKRPDFSFTSAGSSTGTDSTKHKKTGTSSPHSFFKSKKENENVHLNKEEVISNVLRDPFARRVFEDIYSEIRHGKKKVKGILPGSSQGLMDTFPLQIGRTVVNSMKDLLRKQIDDEQTVTVPVNTLLPGMRIRLQVQQGMSGKTQSIEITLPLDYIPGRPVRLRGLGRKIGPWLGDLYLRIIPKVA